MAAIYAAIIMLLTMDFVWALVERSRQAAIPREWIWYDIIMALIFAVIILVDWFIINYKKDKELNHFCYWAASIVAILSLLYGYIYQIDYLID